MKFIKKLGLFITTALIVTIGGVYAAWVYPSDDANVGTVERTFTGSMADIEADSDKGKITINEGGAIIIKIDDAGDYEATPVATSNSIEVTFTHSDGVSDDIAQNGIEMEAVVTISGDQVSYTADDGHSVKIFVAKEDNVIDLGPKGFSATITGEQVLTCLDFCVDGDGTQHQVTLETLAENEAFENILNTYTIHVMIREKAN